MPKYIRRSPSQERCTTSFMNHRSSEMWYSLLKRRLTKLLRGWETSLNVSLPLPASSSNEVHPWRIQARVYAVNPPNDGLSVEVWPPRHPFECSLMRDTPSLRKRLHSPSFLSMLLSLSLSLETISIQGMLQVWRQYEESKFFGNPSKYCKCLKKRVIFSKKCNGWRSFRVLGKRIN